MSRYALGQGEALAQCDRCAFTYHLNELRYEVVNFVLTRIKVCPTCWDMDHPQYRLNRRGPVTDPMTLDDPRPDTSRHGSVCFIGWNPVGFVSSSTLNLALGTVTVRIT